MRDTLRNSLIVAAAMLTLSTSCQADGLSMGVGSDYSSGDYGGTDRTTIFSVPVHAKYTSGPVTLKVIVPWLRVSGTGVVIPTGLGGIGGAGGDAGGAAGGSGGSTGVFGCAADTRGGAPRPEDNGPCASTAAAGGGTKAAARRTEQGLGDIVAAATYNAINSNGLLLDVTGKLKLGTASETRGLGSGKTDYALQFEAEKAIGEAYVMGGLGYKWLSDPAGVSLRNIWYGLVGGGIKLTPDTTSGISYDYAGAANSSGEPLRELSFYLSHRIGENVKLNGYIFKGLTNGGPDWGAGAGLSYAF